MERHKRWTSFGTVAIFVLLVAAACGQDKPTASSSDKASSSTALITGYAGSFEGNDGNLIVDTAGKHDWNSPVETITCPSAAPGAGTNCGLDLVKSQVDDALGQGSKEDDPVPTIVDGSIPPSKDDLSRFYVNKEKAGGNDYLYLAWERSNLLGSAHMDFEFNQSKLLTSNGVTPVRSEGDLLIDFDFGGSGVPVLAYHRWLTPNNGHTPADCEASTTLPCWGTGVDLTGSGFADAQVNSAPVVDTNPPNAPRTLDGNTKNGINSTFGEAMIDLTGSGIFTAGTCTSFGQAWLKSRSSGNSFTSELKDFIAPIPVFISNCGSITIIKHTAPRGVNQSFSYSTTPTTGGLSPSTFSLNDNGNTNADSTGNTQTYSNVFAGTYTVTEGADPTGFVFDNVTCTTSGGATTSISGKTVTITMVPDGNVTCTYVNDQQLGAIQVTKTSTKGNSALAGAVFTITAPGASSGTDYTTNSSGIICVDKLAFGTYTVKEKSAPTGYQINDTTTHNAVVNANAKCSDAIFGGASLSFSDTPLSRITVSFQSLAGAGVTSATIQCTGEASTAPLPEGTPKVLDNLIPGTYACTVVVDP